MTNEERRNAILDIAERLFYTEGYAQTSVERLIREADIAKGTFYYYFASKEELMKAVVTRYIRQEGERFAAVVDGETGSALDKLRNLFAISRPSRENRHKAEMIEVVHLADAEIHMRSIAESFSVLVPLLTKVVRQGVAEGAFACTHPEVATQFIVTGMQFLFHDGFFPSTDGAQLRERLAAFAELCEDLLHAERGALSFFRLLGEDGEAQ